MELFRYLLNISFSNVTFLTSGIYTSHSSDLFFELKDRDDGYVSMPDRVFTEKVCRTIIDNMSDTGFNVKKLVSKFRMSRTLFYNRIKKVTGLQPIELLLTIRLKKAAFLLQHSDCNITEVAYIAGYIDVRYFSTSFKKFFGVTPTAYRRKMGSAS